MALQGSELAVGKDARPFTLQILKHGLCLQSWVHFEHGPDPVPDLPEGVRADPPGMRGLGLTRKIPETDPFAGSSFTHAGFGCSHTYGRFRLHQLDDLPDLPVTDYPSLRR